MTSHLKVIEGFVKEARFRRGSRVYADRADDAVYSYGRHFPLVVRLADGFLVNGTRRSVSTSGHQSLAISALQREGARYAAVPFDAIRQVLSEPNLTSWFDSSLGSYLVGDLRKWVLIAVPSAGERWREVPYVKQDGTRATRSVHTLGDSVLQVRERYYVSAVDETGTGRGLYFMTELHSQRAPVSLADAIEMLKPEIVLRAESEGREVPRQGEWFSIAMPLATTRELMKDVRRRIAVHRRRRPLGRNGHHVLTDAVVYKHGPRKGEVYARGTMRHLEGDHRLLRLPRCWSRIVHSVQGRSYSLSGRGMQFD